MAVLGRLLVSSAERLDLPDFLSIDSYTQGDFKYLLSSFVGGDTPYILKGFDVINPGAAIGTQNISVRVADSVAYYPGSLAGPFFHGLEEGNTLSTPLVPELRKNSTNYVYLTLTTTEAAKDTRAFWDPDKEGGVGGEFTQDVNTQTALSVAVNVSVSAFPENTVPVCKVVVGANFITSIEDARELMFRLGAGGLNPNPLSTYAFRSDPTASYSRTEPNTLMSNALDPNSFQGGDKNIQTLKEWMDVVMTKLLEFGGTTYWYEDTSSYSLINIFKDALATSIKSKGEWQSSTATAGLLTWTEDIVVQSIVDKKDVIIRAGNKTLTDNQVMYVDQNRGEEINTGAVAVEWFNGVNYVNGTLGSFESLTKGDWVKKADDPEYRFLRVEEFYAAANLAGGVTSAGNALSIKLSDVYAGIAETKQGIYVQGEYLTSDVIVGDRDDSLLADAGGDLYWLAMRSDTIMNISDITTTTLSIDIEDHDGTRAKCTLASHGLQDKQQITIAGSTNFDGTYAIEAEDADTFYILVSGGPHADELGEAAFFATVTTAARATADSYQLESATHNFDSGQKITLSSTTNYNGDFNLFTTGVSTFTIPVGSAIANESAGEATSVNMYIRTDMGPKLLSQGENSGIGGDSENVALFIGMDNASQTYPTYHIAPDYNTINGYPNFNSDITDNLTQRVSKLTGMMADRAQDKTVQFVPTETDRVVNTTNAADQDITFVSLAALTPTLNVILPASDLNGTMLLTSTISLAVNEVAYIIIDRNDGFALANPTVSTIEDMPLEENTFVIATRLAGTDIYLWDGTVVPADETREFKHRERIVGRQNLNAKLIDGASISWEDTLQGEIQTLTFATASDAGTIQLGYEGTLTTAMVYTTTLAALQTELRTITGDASLAVTGPASVDLGGVFTCTFSDTITRTLIYEEDNLLELASADVSLTEARTQTGGPTATPTGNLILAADAYVQIPGQSDISNTISAQTVAMTTDGEVAYISLSRVTGVSVRSVTVADIASVPLTDPDTYIIARRIGINVLLGEDLKLIPNQAALLGDNTADIVSYMGATSIYDTAPNYSESLGSFTRNSSLIDGENLTKGAKRLDIDLGATNLRVQQNKTVKLIEGGTFSWDLGTTTISWSADAFVSVAGVTKVSNEINVGSTTLTADGQAAYVSINRTSGAATLTVNTADVADIINHDDIFIFARRIGNSVLIGTGSDLLEDGEFLTLDGSLQEINKYHGQLSVTPESPISQRVTISGSDIAKLSGSQISLEQKNLLLEFDGAVIDFDSGEVFESDGSTPFLAQANDITPFAIPANEYFYYSISVLPNTTTADNKITGQILIIPASASDAVLADAPKAAFPSAGLKLANVLVQMNSGGTAIEVIDYANIIQLGVGGGGGGTGDANELLERLKNRWEDSLYLSFTPMIASQDEDDLLDDGTTTAAFDIANSSYNYSGIGQIVQTIQLLDPNFLLEGTDVSKADLVAYWDLTTVDPAATYAISRDGGNEFQAISMDRIKTGDGFQGQHSFTDEATFATTLDHDVSNADVVTILTDVAGTVEAIGQEVTIADAMTVKRITSHLNKTGTPIGHWSVQLVKDAAGSPSTDVADVVFESVPQDITSLASGNNDVPIDLTAPIIAGTYHLVWKTSDVYKADYSTGVDEIGVRADSTSPAVDALEELAAGTWSAGGGEGAVYQIDGRILDLRLKITSSVADADLLGLGIFYERDIAEYATNSNAGFDRDVQQFSGDDNTDTFTIAFNGDAQFLTIYEIGTGQAFRPGTGSFTVNGNTVIFPADTFDKAGETITLEFFQLFEGSLQFDSLNRQILSANNLGHPTDGALDMSQAGRGIYLRRPDGTLVELTIDDDNNIAIYSV